MPEGATYVGRPSPWGNPFVPGTIYAGVSLVECWEDALELFRVYAAGRSIADPAWLVPLAGHDLACWCPTDKPCHADVLLELLAKPPSDAQLDLFAPATVVAARRRSRVSGETKPVIEAC